MSIMLTKQGYEKIINELHKLIDIDRPLACKMMEESRPVGVIEDNPEYMQALDNQNRIDKKIVDLRNIINNCSIFEKPKTKPSEISFGVSVKFINCNTDEIKEYKIVSVYESNINNGLISIESPFVRNIIGMEIGEMFEFNDIEYEIIDLNYF